MTKKDKLLNEQTIRRWAKLADVSVISETFFAGEEETTEENVTENIETDETEEDETETVTEEEAVTDENTIEEEAHEEGEEEGDMEVDMEPGEADDAEGMDVVQAVLKALEPFGVELEDEAEAAPEMDMDAEPEAEEPGMEEPAMKDPAMDHGMGDHYNRKDETLELDIVDEEAMTEAVLKRVLKRILTNKK